MDGLYDKEIRRSRKALQNPYAYLNGEGGYDAISRNKKMDVHEARRVLQNQYAYLDKDGGYSEYPFDGGDAASSEFFIKVENINLGRQKGQRYSRKAIENIARKLQKEMWLIRKDLFPSREEVDTSEILVPSLALELLGYSVQIQETLGQYSANGELFEVAGIIDDPSKQVRISRRLSPVIRNFTTAHELGHAVLHEESGLHRDRPLDGSPNGLPRNNMEMEADTFAAYFLLPEKPVQAAFKNIFLTNTFILEENTAFALTSENLEILQNRCRTLRDLTRILASAERYNGVKVISMANRFKVSIEAMAIRLEELNLVRM